MVGKVIAVIAGIVLFMFAANQNGIGCLNSYMEKIGVKQKRVKEPKIFSPFIRHEDITSMSVIESLGTSTYIKYDGKVYISILVHSILSLIICLLLIAAVIVAACVYDYLMWWALLIAVGYSIALALTYFYYWVKAKKEKSTTK